jgi:hypothetical protein
MVEKREHEDLEIYYGGEPKNGAVLYLGGWADFPIYHKAVPRLLNRFENNGFAAMAAPYRGVLGQSGEFTVVSMVDDALEQASILAEKSGEEEVIAVGNCMGANAALGAAAETDVIGGVVTMNGLFGMRNDPWWNSDEEWGKRAARWSKIEQGEDGILGTEFVGLDEDFFKQDVCTGPDRVAHDERLDGFAHLPLLMMVSYKDKKIDPLHTWTLYRYLRNYQEEKDIEEQAEIEVVRKEDKQHTLLLTDEELQDRVISWIKQN